MSELYPPRRRSQENDHRLKVLQCAADGLSIRETAEKLFLVEQTVKYHRGMIIDILEAKNMTHAVAIALRKEIIE